MKRLSNGKDPIPRRIWISTKNNLLQQRYGAPLSQNGFHGPTFRKRDAPPFFLLVENLFCTKGNYKFINQSFCQVLYVWKEKRGKNGRRELLIQDTTIYLKRYLTAITNNFTCYNTRPLLLF
jgi:hypothetical protein